MCTRRNCWGEEWEFRASGDSPSPLPPVSYFGSSLLCLLLQERDQLPFSACQGRKVPGWDLK